MAILSFLSFINSQKEKKCSYILFVIVTHRGRWISYILLCLHNHVISEHFDTKTFPYCDCWNNVYSIIVMAVIIILKSNDEQAVLGFCFSICKRKNLGWAIITPPNLSFYSKLYIFLFAKLRKLHGIKRSTNLPKTELEDKVNINFCPLTIFV